ncbi:MAG: hypothetical protein U9Q81_00350 [Pseudomonadota bacterium]|nr:hypothetical protein [Pseudomonadota bacterium]
MNQKQENEERGAFRRLPTAEEVSKAAYDPKLTLRLVEQYKLSAVDLANLLDRLPVKPVPW